MPLEIFLCMVEALELWVRTPGFPERPTRGQEPEPSAELTDALLLLLQISVHQRCVLRPFYKSTQQSSGE